MYPETVPGNQALVTCHASQLRCEDRHDFNLNHITLQRALHSGWQVSCCIWAADFVVKAQHVSHFGGYPRDSEGRRRNLFGLQGHRFVEAIRKCSDGVNAKQCMHKGLVRNSILVNKALAS